MRAARRSLSLAGQKRASRAFCRRIARLPVFRRAGHIGLYLASDGEIDCAGLMSEWARPGQRFYVPVVDPRRTRSMRFARITPVTRLRRNRYGISEPHATRGSYIRPALLHLVIVPLVAFDGRGNRLGMGSGYYDRCFRFLRRRASTPTLIGAAHAFQEVPSITPDEHDVPLHAVVTERRRHVARPAR